MKYLLTIVVKDEKGKSTFIMQGYESMYNVLDDLIKVIKMYTILNIVITNLENNND